MAKLHFWPKRGQWDPMWSEFDSIWIKFDPNWVKLGPNEAQSIFTNSRSTAQADVMLGEMPETTSNGTWEALDSSELIVFDVGGILDTLATHSENLFDIF